MTALAAFETTTIDINEVYSHARKVAYSFNLSREQVEDHVQEAVIKVIEQVETNLEESSRDLVTKIQTLRSYVDAKGTTE